jgi:hypothetical protein
MPDKSNKSNRERKKETKKSDKNIYTNKHIRLKENLIKKKE